MDNAEEILQALEEFSKLKPKEIPKELDEYLGYVAKTGDPVYQWHLVKYLFHEKLLNVITEFYETSPTIDLPPCPNVDPFNYERMKTSLLERLDTFTSAPFTVQRICELLTNPKKQYNRVDKFMRAIEKNILVVSTREPGVGKRLENDQTEAVLNGIPDSKISENDERIVNVCSENLQYNSTDSSPVPVENAINACIIQEQIEIDNSTSSTGISGETKTWCESNDESGKKDTDNIIKTDNLVDNTEINVVSTTSSIVSNEPLKSDSLFTENDSEVKEDKLDNVEESSTENIICNEPIISSTPDSPDSPEPSNSAETCEPSSDDNNLSPLKTPGDIENECNVNTENENLQDNENITDDVSVEEEKKLLESEDSIIESTTSNINLEPSQVSEEMLNVSTTQDVQEQGDGREETVDELTVKQLSPETVQQPDSSDDSHLSGSGGGGDDGSSRESDMNVQIENAVENDDDDDNTGKNSELTEGNAAELIDVSSSQVSITIQEEEATGGDEVEESSNEGLIVKEVDDDEETRDSQKSEELKDSIEIAEENVVIATNEEAVASSDECVSIEEISEVKDVEDSSNTETGIVESSNEILDELCEQERREGSIIHATPNNVGSEPSLVEDICVDQSSCGPEEEAMDVDETSNQQMVTSESEAEGEPMDQSEQLQS